jgi:hypothetical protein
MDEPFETFEHAGKVVKLYYDPDPLNPREEYDHLGTILYRGSARYRLGDKGVDPREIQAVTERKDVVWLPVYAYIHSGIVLNTTGFHDPWDSGQSGVIYIEHAKIREEYSRKRITKALVRKVEQLLVSEVKEFSDFLAGEVYGFVVESPQGDVIESCWGFIGDLDYCRDQAKESAA